MPPTSACSTSSVSGTAGARSAGPPEPRAGKDPGRRGERDEGRPADRSPISDRRSAGGAGGAGGRLTAIPVGRRTAGSHRAHVTAWTGHHGERAVEVNLDLGAVGLGDGG